MKKLLLGALLASGFASLSASANTIFTCDGLVDDVRYNGYQYVIEFKNVYGVYQDSAKIQQDYLLGQALKAESDGRKGIYYTLVVQSDEGDRRCRDNDGSLTLLALVKK